MTHPNNFTSEQAKLAKLRMLELKLKHQKQLPHLHLHKFYKWQRQFFISKNRMLLLTAANQIGKSTVQIKKIIELATNKSLWPEYWPRLGPEEIPNQFWYLYPSKDVATAEFQTKWLPLLPRGDYKDHPVYGWKESWRNGKIESIYFNLGILVLFKVYEQKESNLQSGTVYYVACDEELPYELYNELKARTRSCEGLFSMAFTATLGQEFWRLAMEPKEDEKPNFPKAEKIQVSLFDCRFFEDGSPGQYHDEAKIQEAIDDCSTENEVLKRVFGRFVKSEGLIYPTFSASDSCVNPVPIPRGWKIYVGIDSGSGDQTTDPAAIVFVAVSPDYKKGYVTKAWRGDKELTVSDDIIRKYLEMKGDDEVELVVYDWSDKDLQTIATRMGLSFIRADKNHERGQKALNTLFKNKILQLFRDGDILKLSTELCNLSHGQRKPVDHLSDALRYVCVMIPWDWSVIEVRAPVVQEEVKPPTVDDLRRGIGYDHNEEYTIEDEFDEINALMHN